ncbi:MAG: DUF5720 family protein [Enterocloster bolteae]|uniref:DUF5720 family protein n=1 Tax=Lachnospiraceae TaxID=186803 RepID=UPI0039964BAC
MRDRLTVAKTQEPLMLGHDLFGPERYSPHTHHRVAVNLLASNSPIGCPRELYRFFLSDE